MTSSPSDYLTADDLLTRIQATINEIDLPALTQRLNEYRRGGLPTNSIPGRRGSGNPQLPELDQLDTKIEEAENDLFATLDTALDALAQAVREQDSWMNPAPDVDAPPRPVCPTCGDRPKGTRNDRIIDGECIRCWRYRLRTGKKWARPKAKRKKKR